MRYVAGLVLVLVFAEWLAAADPLDSWQDTVPKRAIIEFVNSVTKSDSPGYVPPTERIAVFDNDGTLWCEQPMYVQLAFAIDRIKTLAPEHPEWKDTQPFKGVLSGDYTAVAATGEKGLMELVMASHAGQSTEEFERFVKVGRAPARHPKFLRPYTECVYQPMLELLAYLRNNGFKIFIVSGGGIEFMRPWAEKVYGVPPERIVGSSIKTKYEALDGKPVIASPSRS